MSHLDFDPSDVLIDCGWCGHTHASGDDCGCVPCPSCGAYHGAETEEDR